MHCRRFQPPPISRREMLARAAGGFGAAALAALAQRSRRTARSRPTNGRDGVVGRDHPAKAKSVIFLYMDGGPSQVDTFDPKPRLDREHGKPIKMKTPPTQFANVGNVLQVRGSSSNTARAACRSAICLPHIATCADDLCVDPFDDVELLGAHVRQLLPALGQRPARPAEHGGVDDLRPRQRVPRSAGLRRAERRPDSARRTRQLRQRLSCRRVSRLGLQGRARRRWPMSTRREADRRAAAQQAQAARPARSRSARARAAPTTRWNRPSPTTNWRIACRRPCPR